MFVLGAGLISCDPAGGGKVQPESSKQHYETLLKTVKPRMSRRELYAVLPPHTTPAAFPAAFSGRAYSAGLYYAHQEKHELDEAYFLVVEYQVRTESDYEKPAREAAAKVPLKTKTGLEFEGLPVRSMENPDDIIERISLVQIAATPAQFYGRSMTSFPYQIYR